MKKLLITLSVLSITTISTAQAHRNGVIHTHPKNKVVVIQPRRVIVAPVYNHHHAWLAVAATVGIILSLDANGNTVDNNGNQVVVLDSNNHSEEKAQVIQKNNVTYILK